MVRRFNEVCLLLCLQLIMVHVCEAFVLVRSTHSEKQLEEDRKTICTGSTCEKYLYSYILRRFPGIFYTREQIAVKEIQFALTRQEYLKKQNVYLTEGLLGDGDSCCPTDVQAFSNLTMENLYGERRFIVHMPPRYQFIPHGFCLKGGKCDGSCVVEPVTQTLLTYNPTLATLEFDQFIVPGYCSCKAS